MEKFNVKINLQKLDCKVFQTKSGKYFLGLPLDGSQQLYCGKSGVYLSLQAIPTPHSQFGKSHLLKLQVTKEVYNNMSDDDRALIPIIGDMEIRPDFNQPATDVDVIEDL